MKTKILALVLGALLTIPCVLRAEEVEIQLMEVVGMGTIEGDNPLDDPIQNIELTEWEKEEFLRTLNGEIYTMPAARRKCVKVFL